MQKTFLLSQWVEKCQQRPGVLAIPESLEPRMIKALVQLCEWRALGTALLFCGKDEFYIKCQELAVDPKQIASHIRFAAVEFPEIATKCLQLMQELARTKGKTLDASILEKDCHDALFQAATLLALGHADAVIAGAVATTAAVIRAGLHCVGLATPGGKISSSFILERRKDASASEILMFADCGVIIKPNESDLVSIAAESTRMWEAAVGSAALPVVAFLSFSTKGSAKHEDVEKMKKAAQQFHSLYPDIASDGELQFDAAYIAEIGARKAPGSKAAGKANCFIFPDLNSGNIAYKIAQRLGGFAAYGPLLQGFKKPYSDLSRGATVEDIVASCLINLLRAKN